MATAAFKSSTKRGTTVSSSNSNSTHSNKNNGSNSRILRRSRSVSAISRTALDSIPAEFSNRRDNPLFSSSSPPQAAAPAPAADTLHNTQPNSAPSDRRGRSVTRNLAPKAGIGRSVSRGRYGSYQSEEEEILKLSNSRRQSGSKQLATSGRMSSLTRNAGDARGRAKSSWTATSRGHVADCSEDDSAYGVQFANWEDGISNGSMSEAEEKAAVHEQMKSVHGAHWRSDPAAGGIYETVRSEVRRAFSDIQHDLENAIRRNNVSSSTTNVTEIHSDLVNPGAVELVLDIRKEYTRKLEESEERARKLREDLAVEEHRGQELSRILKEIVPEPKTSNSQRSCLRRRTSSERKSMSKRLTEEAMAYFDECVSISTFESSDFSAPEDPFHSSVGTTNLVGGPGCFQQVNSSILATHGQESNHTQISNGCDILMHGPEDSGLTASSSSGEPSIDEVGQTERSHQFLFSAADTLSEINGPRNDIKSYVKHCNRDVNRDEINADNGRSSYDADEYKSHGFLESFLFDKLLFRNRIESGSLHLCGGGLAILFSPSI